MSLQIFHDVALDTRDVRAMSPLLESGNRIVKGAILKDGTIVPLTDESYEALLLVVSEADESRAE